MEYTLVERCGDVGATMEVKEVLLLAPGKGRKALKRTREERDEAAKRGGRELKREMRNLKLCVWFRMRGVEGFI